jgi:hypothetical protein
MGIPRAGSEQYNAPACVAHRCVRLKLPERASKEKHGLGEWTPHCRGETTGCMVNRLTGHF